MSSSLRKLGKRLHRNSPPDIAGADERDSQRARQDRPEKQSPSNDFSIPAPPPKSLQREERKTPPPKNLQKYKAKSPANIFTNPPTADNESKSTANSRTSSSESVSKVSNGEGGTSSNPPQIPTVRRVTAQGCEFEMMDSDHSNPTNSEEDLAATIRQPASEGPTLRSTRSSTRRRENRSDSLQSDQDNISTKDFAAISKSSHGSLKVPGLNIRKNKIPATTTTTTSDPQTSRRKSNEFSRTPSPGDTSASPTPPPTNFSRPNLSPSPSDTTTHYTASSPRVEAYKASTPLSIPETLPTSSITYIDDSEPLARALSTDSTEAIRPQTVKVRPPMYDMTKTPSQQWEQFGITSSRPERAWDGCPRWTCCICGAATIVEQLVCANLECGHDRCHNRCQVLREPKKMGLFLRG